jgi:hypothetical protein
MAVITREEFEEWQGLEVTKALKATVKRDLALMQDNLVECDVESLKELQGRCKTCLAFLDMQYEDIV